MIRRLVALSAVVAVAVIGVSASAQQAVTYKAHLTAKDEVPPNASAAMGDATVTLNHRHQRAHVGRDLQRPQRSRARRPHPRTRGSRRQRRRGRRLRSAEGARGRDQGQQSVILASQVADLKAGKWYINVHTAANKGGEIRGQLMP